MHFSCNDHGGFSGVATCEPSTDPTFTSSTSSVAASATDIAGNSSTGSFGPINIDKIRPAISVSATKADGGSYTAGSWTNQDVTVHYSCADADSGVASCTPDHVFNSSGTTASTSGTATDYAGNSASASFGPITIDKVPPSLTVPANMTVNATSPAGATVNWGVTPSDGLSGISSVVCSPASGSVFPIGLTTVTCTATDNAGNAAPKSFTVQVNGAAAQLSALFTAVTKVAPGSAMANKIKQVQGYVAINNKTSACSGLTDFISLVKAQSGKKLTAAQATSLITQANNIRATLGC